MMSRPGVLTSSFHHHQHGHYGHHHLGLGHGVGGGGGGGGGGYGQYGGGRVHHHQNTQQQLQLQQQQHQQQRQHHSQQSRYEGAGVGVNVNVGVGVGVDHSGLTYRAPLPIRAPELPTGAAFGNHHPPPQQQLANPNPNPSANSSQQPQPHPHPQPHLQHHLPHHQHHGRPATAPALSMADNAYMPSEEELAQMQKMSSEYEPEATGPLVGERQSSSAITTEYANADSVYRIKTAALPAKYAYFRTCRGDGQCGWRAIAFTYFEALLRVGDANKLEDEEARLNSMGNLLDQAGYSRDVYVDFAEEAWDLLRKLAVSLKQMDGNEADILLTTFNDQGTSMAIITYLKLLASAWVQGNADEYRHFVPMGDIKAYCSYNIEASASEADNVGIAALADALIKPAGFGLEVWYLDRSPGEEINRSYYAEPTDHNHMPLPNAPMLRLLYRPGHYDILYKAEDFPTPVQQSVPPQPPLHVALAAGYADDFVPSESNMTDVMSMIPGLYTTGIGQRWPSYDYAGSPASQPQITTMQPYAPAPSPAAPVTTSHIEYVSPIQAPSHVSHHNPPSHHIQLEQPPVTLPIHPPPPPPLNIERATSIPVERGGPFRPSMYELEPGFGSSNQAQPFQTSIFRNSHFNTAHFLNPDFQPEEWSPDAEYATGNKGRHKSTSS